MDGRDRIRNTLFVPGKKIQNTATGKAAAAGRGSGVECGWKTGFGHCTGGRDIRGGALFCGDSRKPTKREMPKQKKAKINAIGKYRGEIRWGENRKVRNMNGKSQRIKALYRHFRHRSVSGPLRLGGFASHALVKKKSPMPRSSIRMRKWRFRER